MKINFYFYVGLSEFVCTHNHTDFSNYDAQRSKDLLHMTEVSRIFNNYKNCLHS